MPLLVCLCLLAACTGNAPDGPCTAAVERAQTLIAAGRYSLALTQLDSAQSHAAPCPRALAVAGNLHARLGRLEEAERAYREALALTRDDAETRHNLAVVIADRGRHPEAVTLLEETVARRPDFAAALLSLALLHIKEGGYSRAESLLTAGTALDSATVEFYWRLGQLATRRGQYERAENLLREAVQRDASAAEAWRLLGQLYAERGQHEQALAAYEEALARRPALIETHYNLSKSLLALGRQDEGRGALLRFQRLSAHAAHIAHLRRALDAGDDAPQTRLALAYHYTRLGDPAAAQTQYRAALLADPDHIEALIGLSRLLYQEGQADAAVALCTEAAARLADDPQLYRIIEAAGQAHMAAGRLQQAEAAFRRSLDLRPDYAPAWLRLGLLQQLRNNPTAALAAFQRAVEADPDLAEAQLHLGQAKARWGDSAGATTALRRALHADSTLAPAYLTLGQLYERSNPAAAVEAYRRFIAYWDGDPQALRGVHRALKRLASEAP